MKKILIFASALILSSNVAFAANQSSECGQCGQVHPPNHLENICICSQQHGRTAAGDENLIVDPLTDDPIWIIELSRDLQMLGLCR